MNKLKLIQTCSACPEQYDVYSKDEHVGYMRLRHGFFYAECNGIRVYEANPNGDGIFEINERDKYLNEACQAILNELSIQEKTENLFNIEYDYK